MDELQIAYQTIAEMGVENASLKYQIKVLEAKLKAKEGENESGDTED